MSNQRRDSAFTRLLSDYGMLIVLVLLCILFSALTVTEQTTTGKKGAELLSKEVIALYPHEGRILILAGLSPAELEFANEMKRLLRADGYNAAGLVGEPSDLRTEVSGDTTGPAVTAVVTTDATRPIVLGFRDIPPISGAQILTPPKQHWPTFLLADNLRNVANQIVVIAIVAIGMTMVIITAGIDLSVGSLIALSAVVIAWVAGALGGTEISSFGILVAAFAALVACALTGAFSGLMITGFKIPPFIATLAMMQVAAGIAYIISQGKPIYQLPDNFVWLGRGTEPLLDLPIAVLLMLLLYFFAWVLMERSVLGRYIYAVGGNPEAARLAGINVNRVLLFVYTLCGLLAGLGGIIMASQLKSGAPTYGLTYELYVIAAVVVGGTSLSGGEGKIIGTLIGAFIIAVIQNGMNLTNIETYTQKVVLGLVILAAVLFDRLKQKGLMHRLRTSGPDRSNSKVTSS
ncbi:MAG: ABC transporter permease [bacterium]|nr:ABC transporter permease [bacterium]